MERESNDTVEIKWDKQVLKDLDFLSWFFDIVIDGDKKTIKFLSKTEV